MSMVLPRSHGLLIALLLSSCVSQPYIPIVSNGFRIPADFKIVGYFPSWSGDPESLQYRALTHICYAFSAPTMDGGTFPIDHEDKLYRVMALAHQNNAKILLTFGGWDAGKPNAYEAIAADERLTDRFANRLADLISRYNLDGIDIDLEFPTEETAVNFAHLIHELGIKLHAMNKILSIAVSADDVHGKYYLDSIIDDVDFLNIMAYDDGFGETEIRNHSAYAFASKALDYWIGTRHAPRAKAILGVPFYGRSLIDRHSISYYRIHKYYDWSSATDSACGFGYNGFDTIRAKTVNLARYRGGGIMVWQLNQDANGSDSLLNAIFDAIKEPCE